MDPGACQAQSVITNTTNSVLISHAVITSTFPYICFRSVFRWFFLHFISSSEAFGWSLWHQIKRARTDTLTHTCNKTKSDTVLHGNTNTLWIIATSTGRRECSSRRGQSHLRRTSGRKTGDYATRLKDCGVLWVLHTSRFCTVVLAEH